MATSDRVQLSALDQVMPRFYTRLDLTFETGNASIEAACRNLELGFDKLVREIRILNGVICFG